MIIQLTYNYLIFYRGMLATKKLTLAGARKLKRQLMKEKGWKESEIEIKPAPPEGVNERGN